MELILSLCFGAFAGALIMWAWWSINPGLLLKKIEIRALLKEIENEKEELSKRQTHAEQALEGQMELERRRISDELHDDLLQRLAGIRLYLLHITTIHSLPLEAEHQINRLANDLSDAVDTTRTLIWDLALPEVKGKTLTQLIEELCQKIGRTSMLKVTCLTIMGEWERPITDEVKKDVCRMVQESIYNALKYSNGWHVGVTLQWHTSHASIIVLDDGEGIPEQKGKGFGMENLKKRAERIKAMLEIADARPHGTSVKIDLPYTSLG
ncbi:MAG TPA: histidine kinase [Cyclobacteriaceae bacterium]